MQKVARNTDGDNPSNIFSLQGNSNKAFFLEAFNRYTLGFRNYLLVRKKKSEESDARLEAFGNPVATKIKVDSDFDEKIANSERDHLINGSSKSAISRETYDPIRPQPPAEVRFNSFDTRKSTFIEVAGAGTGAGGSTSTSQDRTVDHSRQKSFLHSSRKVGSNGISNGNIAPSRKSVTFMDTPDEHELTRTKSFEAPILRQTFLNSQAFNSFDAQEQSSGYTFSTRNGGLYSKESVPSESEWSSSSSSNLVASRKDNVRSKSRTMHDVELIDDFDEKFRDAENEYDESYSTKKRQYPFTRQDQDHHDSMVLAETGSEPNDCDFQRKKRIGLDFHAAMQGARALIVQQGLNSTRTRPNYMNGYSGQKRDRRDADSDDEERKKRSMLKLNGESSSEDNVLVEAKGVRIEPVSGRPVLKRNRKVSDLEEANEFPLFGDDLTSSTYTQRRVELIKKKNEIIREANRLAEGM